MGLYHPYVTDAHYITENTSGEGAARACHFDGFSVRETALEWNEGESYVVGVEFTDGPAPPITDPRGLLKVEEHGDGTLFTMRMTYQPKFGVMGKLMDRIMIRPRYDKMVRGILAGLKHYAETGEEMNEAVRQLILTTPATA